MNRLPEALQKLRGISNLATAEKFSDSVYDFIETLADDMIIHALCRNPDRNAMGLKCKNFGKKYTVVFLETDK